MAKTYIGYAQREAETNVNWGAVATQFSDMLSEQQKLKEGESPTKLPDDVFGSPSKVPKKFETEAVATLVRPMSPSAILVLEKLAGPLRFM